MTRKITAAPTTPPKASTGPMLWGPLVFRVKSASQSGHPTWEIPNSDTAHDDLWCAWDAHFLTKRATSSIEAGEAIIGLGGWPPPYKRASA